MLTLELKGIHKEFKLKKSNPFFFRFKKRNNVSSSKIKNALIDINLKFFENEIVGIIGGNGAGKSTLTQIIYGITQPTSGEVNSNKKITALFGFGSCFNPELTGRENIYLSATAYGLTKSQVDKYVSDIIEFSEIDEIDIQLKFYSNGMKSRLGFSIAAYIESEILILDEALVGGDVFFQKKCVIKLKEIIAQPGRTFIIISHSESLLKELCTRIVVMEKGKVVLESSPSEAFEYYKRNL